MQNPKPRRLPSPGPGKTRQLTGSAWKDLTAITAPVWIFLLFLLAHQVLCR